MKIRTPEELAALNFGKKVDKSGFDTLTEVTLPPETEEDRAFRQHIENQLSEVTEMLISEQEEILRSDSDEVAKAVARAKLLQYRNIQRNEQKTGTSLGLVISKKFRSKISTKKTATWCRTKCGWALKTSRKCSVGDEIECLRKGGIRELMRLTVQLDGNGMFFRGEKIGG